jgi:membrane-bound lytic murein transglycosylase B
MHDTSTILLKRMSPMSPWIEYDFNTRMNRLGAVLVTALFVLCCVVPLSVQAEEDQWKPLRERLILDGFDRQEVNAMFARAGMRFDPSVMARKMNVLLSTHLTKSGSVEVAQPKPLTRYLNPVLLAGAYAYLREHADLLQRIEGEYGVSDDIVVAVFLVETKLGKTIGDDRAFSVLANMALGGDFSRIDQYVDTAGLDDDTRQWLVQRTLRKGNWAFEELKALLTYCRQADADPVTLPASVYGAIGLCQFMPTSALHYGRDGDGDGKIDLFVEADALFSMANYLKEHGWKAGLSFDEQAEVIYAYNHSMHYALTILEVADRLRKTDSIFGRS